MFDESKPGLQQKKTHSAVMTEFLRHKICSLQMIYTGGSKKWPPPLCFTVTVFVMATRVKFVCIFAISLC